MSYKKPLPRPNPDSRPFWDACRKHKFQFQKCAQCGSMRWPPAFICPHCHSGEYRWVEVSGRGKIYTYAVIHRAYRPEFADDLPYVTAIIELEEGVRMLSNIIECDPARLACDMDVELVWDDITGEFSLPKFKPLVGRR